MEGKDKVAKKNAALCEGARTERYLICRRIVESNISWRNPWQHEGAKAKAQRQRRKGKGVKGSSVERSKNEKAKNFVGQEFRAHLFVGLFKLGRSALIENGRYFKKNINKIETPK